MDDWWVDFVAGWVSGAAGVVACQPLDTILTRYQAASRLVAGSAAGTASTAFLSPWSSATVLVRTCGVLSLWRGSSPMIGAVPVQNALLMGGYGLGKRCSEHTGGGTAAANANATAGSNQRHDLLPVFVGGCFGGILQSFLMSPVEWIKVRQQTATAATATATTNPTAATSSGTGYLLRTLFRHKSTLWNRGLAATLLRDGIPHGVWFASYELCKTELVALHRRGAVGEEHGDETEHEHERVGSSSFCESVAVPLVSGAFAAATAWAVGYPFDIIKTRIQATTTNAAANPAAGGAAGSGTAVPGVAETARLLVREANGNVLRGLYRGFGWKLVRSIPASMIGFLTYEVVSEGISKPRPAPGA